MNMLKSVNVTTITGQSEKYSYDGFPVEIVASDNNGKTTVYYHVSYVSELKEQLERSRTNSELLRYAMEEIAGYRVS